MWELDNPNLEMAPKCAIPDTTTPLWTWLAVSNTIPELIYLILCHSLLARANNSPGFWKEAENTSSWVSLERLVNLFHLSSDPWPLLLPCSSCQHPSWAESFPQLGWQQLPPGKGRGSSDRTLTMGALRIPGSSAPPGTGNSSSSPHHKLADEKIISDRSETAPMTSSNNARGWGERGKWSNKKIKLWLIKQMGGFQLKGSQRWWLLV